MKIRPPPPPPRENPRSAPAARKPNLLEIRQKIKYLKLVFLHTEKGVFSEVFSVVRITTHSDDYLWYMILRIKQKKKKTPTYPNTKVSHHFSNGRNKKSENDNKINWMRARYLRRVCMPRSQSEPDFDMTSHSGDTR